MSAINLAIIGIKEVGRIKLFQAIPARQAGFVIEILLRYHFFSFENHTLTFRTGFVLAFKAFDGGSLQAGGIITSFKIVSETSLAVKLIL